MRYDVNGTRLHVEVHGEGPPLLLMHGGLGLDHTYFRPFLDPLASDFQLVYYDHRGNGRSERPADWSGIDHSTWVDDADALRAALGHDRVLLFGHSYGGFLALEYALRYPDRLAGLVVCSAAPAVDFAERSMAMVAERASPEQLETLGTALSAPATDDDAFLDAYRRIFPLYFHDPAAAAGALAEVRPSAAAFSRAFFHCLPGYDIEARLGEIETPTLVLGGGSDWFPPPDRGAERLAAGLPDAELVVLDDTGHFPFIEEPERFVDVVRRWARPRAGGLA